MRVEVWDDLWMVFAADRGEYGYEPKLYEISSMSDCGPKFLNEDCHPVGSLDDAEPFAEGFIKWDGCTEFELDFHVCSRQQLANIGEAMLRCWDAGKDMVVHWNSEVAR